ncbi:hypothetical protein CDAR_456741 [Caerostris darwini]|uniref:Uncharacterized protein n=1 Tax=Caerostris darwini TaxID=1538125 RepID=A0AAV4TNJ0_9ARAC|nr:hypothetical protein CDAR_456741 [Caerostris darwini]
MFWHVHPVEIPSHFSRAVCETSPPFQCYSFRQEYTLALKLGPRIFIYSSGPHYVEKLQKILNEVRSDFSGEYDCEEDFVYETIIAFYRRIDISDSFEIPRRF